MNVIALAALSDFWTQHPEAEEPLRAWYRHMRSHEYATFAEVRAEFGSADWVRGFIVFDIGGNKYRVIVNPNFAFKSFFVKYVLTHRQYDSWSQEQRRHK